MSLNNDSCGELECYTKIINCYLKNQNDRQKLEQCKHQSLIKLMKVMDRKEERLIQNALIIVLALFDEIPPDLAGTTGSDLSLLSKREKELALKKIEDEIFSRLS